MTTPRVVVLHGLGGTPHSVLPLTAAVHEAGHPAVAPMLPGHGTHPEDLIGRTWDEWMAFVDATIGRPAYDALKRRAEAGVKANAAFWEGECARLQLLLEAAIA